MRSQYFLAILGLGALAALPASAQVTVYSNNFQTGSTTDFNVSTVSTTPGTGAHPADMFLGQLDNQTVSLTLPSLAAHTTAEISFDLYIIQSMDGDGPFGGGPDPWTLNVAGGPTLINSSFANYPGDTQQFESQALPNAGGQAPMTGATEENTLGYTFGGVPMDSVYHLDYNFANTDSTLVFNFIGGQNQDISDESWGLDNVVVKTNASLPTGTPEPGSIAILSALGLVGTGFSAYSRRMRAI